MTVDFLSENRRTKNFFQVLKEKNCESRITYPLKKYFRNKEEIKTLSDEVRLRDWLPGDLA